ncbi:alpha/beta hydrolase [Lentzea aerocolonigenes]|uniref:alpha/beta hydrolase n=1 Tax=Lentzea aerocolonigenes TaxID=68170 RepID=UPI00056D5FC6|nr:alpha/beta hydrolase [Lentzea aerocolonigenes]MCP2245577.1 Acetyl esterase/lipase [Lentzea aerocolonigenes]
MQFGLNGFIDPALLPHVEEMRELNALRGTRRGPSNLDEVREVRAALKGPGALVDAGGVPVRIIEPQGTPRGVHLDFHGGGFYLGSTAQDDERNQRLADALGVVVVSPDYRLAPEDPWPAAPDDCENTALWLLDEFGAASFTIGGFSAGATLAVTTLLRLRERAGRFRGAVLQFGTYDLSGQTPAGRLIRDEYFIQAYAGHISDRTIPDISPIYGDLRGLPPLLMIVGALDVLLEDNLAMAARVCAAGGSVDLRVYPESQHGFTNRSTGMAKAARLDIERWLASLLDSAG